MNPPSSTGTCQMPFVKLRRKKKKSIFLIFVFAYMITRAASRSCSGWYYKTLGGGTRHRSDKDVDNRDTENGRGRPKGEKRFSSSRCPDAAVTSVRVRIHNKATHFIIVIRSIATPGMSVLPPLFIYAWFSYRVRKRAVEDFRTCCAIFVR